MLTIGVALVQLPEDTFSSQEADASDKELSEVTNKVIMPSKDFYRQLNNFWQTIFMFYISYFR